MAIKLYLDEDVDPLLAHVLRNRGVDCLSTKEAENLGLPDGEQLRFAADQGRTILTFNVKDFVALATKAAISGQHHSGIIVSDHVPFRELLRRVMRLLGRHERDTLRDTLVWLQDYKAVSVD